MKGYGIKKYGIMILAMIAAAILLIGCGKSDKLAGGFEKETLISQAEKDITAAESNDFQGWQARFQPELRTAVTQEMYDQYYAGLEAMGAFQKFGKAAVTTQEQNGITYGIVVYLVEHEKGELKYTIAYDGEMDLVSFTL